MAPEERKEGAGRKGPHLTEAKPARVSPAPGERPFEKAKLDEKTAADSDRNYKVSKSPLDRLLAEDAAEEAGE